MKLFRNSDKSSVKSKSDLDVSESKSDDETPYMKEKAMMLQELCSRLPYGLKCDYREKVGIIESINHSTTQEYSRHWVAYFEDDDHGVPVEMVTPYLRKMESMNNDEYLEYMNLVAASQQSIFTHVYDFDKYDWFHKHHMDYRDLIGFGLALEAPDGMYGYKNK